MIFEGLSYYLFGELALDHLKLIVPSALTGFWAFLVEYFVLHCFSVYIACGMQKVELFSILLWLSIHFDGCR